MAEVMVVERPSRWEVPFTEEYPASEGLEPMNDSDIDRVMAHPRFRDMDGESFPKHLPLREIIRNDARIRRFEHGDVVVREGDYGSSLFVTMEGEVRIIEKGLDPAALGRRENRRRNALGSFFQFLTNPRTPGIRASNRSATSALDLAERNALKTMPRVFEEADNFAPPSDMFGEQGALARRDRTRTVLAFGNTTLLEIRWQGVRDLRQNDPALKKELDERYKGVALETLLRDADLFSEVDDKEKEEQRKSIIDHAQFETYGKFEWHRGYQQDAADPLRQEQLIEEQGNYPNGLIMVVSGFARVTRQHGEGEQTRTFLRRGDTYGLEELIHNKENSKQEALTSSLRAIGYVDIVRIPTPTFEKHIYPDLSAKVLARARLVPDESGIGGDEPGLVASSTRSDVNPAMLEFLGEGRYMNGTATMVIDMDRCTRCDDCVRACATGHLSSPVFLRHGPIFDNFMIANACMHCVDPVCMIDCPTGAIHRDVTGNVVINEKTCVGCEACANGCPYDSIRMIEIRDKEKDEAVMVAEGTGKPILKATKCDLCIDHHGGPACERACPHDALQRLDMQDLDGLARLVNR